MNAHTAILLPADVGERFGGGIVLGGYFLGAEARLLIGASKLDLSRPRMAWNTSIARVAGAQSIYDGLANTRAMLEAGSPAARWATELRIGGKDDWHLGARGQALLAFAANQRLPEEEKFDPDWHWTSTQYAGAERWAWYQYFSLGNQYFNLKNYELALWAVRSEVI